MLAPRNVRRRLRACKRENKATHMARRTRLTSTASRWVHFQKELIVKDLSLLEFATKTLGFVLYILFRRAPSRTLRDGMRRPASPRRDALSSQWIRTRGAIRKETGHEED